LTSSRSPVALVDRDRRADTDGTEIIDGASGTAALKRRPSIALVRTKIAARTAPPQQFFGRDVNTTRQLIANGAVLAKSLIYLSLFGLVSAIAFIYKYVLLALTYVMVRLYPAEFDRDAVIDALSEIKKNSRLNDEIPTAT
jgi:hypothetical protein